MLVIVKTWIYKQFGHVRTDLDSLVSKTTCMWKTPKEAVFLVRDTKGTTGKVEWNGIHRDFIATIIQRNPPVLASTQQKCHFIYLK